MRRKESFGLGWLLLLLVVGLPVAVFLAWKEQNPLLAPSETRNNTPDVAGMGTVPEKNQVQPSPAQTAAPNTAVPGAEPKIPPTKSEPVSSIPKAMPASTPTPSGAPPTPKLDWAEIAASPERWPVQTRTRTPVDFPISVGGKLSGSTRVPPGTSVKVVKITGEGAEVAFSESSVKVAFDQTTLDEQLMNGESRPAPPTAGKSSGPAPAPKPAATPPKNDGSLVPQQNWCKAPGDERTNLIGQRNFEAAFRRELTQWEAARKPIRVDTPDFLKPDEIQKLKSLGYLR